MTAALRRIMTLDEFLAWEANQLERYEFDGFGPVAMHDVTVAHSTLNMNLTAELVGRLRGKFCHARGSILKTLVAGRVRYPDAFVSCTSMSNDATWCADPVVVFEILSKSTALIDCTTKNAEYRATPSIRRYVMLSSESIAATIYERTGNHWVGTLVTDPEAVLALPEIGVELPLAALYDGLEFDAPS